MKAYGPRRTHSGPGPSFSRARKAVTLAEEPGSRWIKRVQYKRAVAKSERDIYTVS